MTDPTSGNLFSPLPPPSPEESFEELLRGDGFHLERIISNGQATPEGQWFDQDADEWVVLLSGSAAIRFEGDEHVRTLASGDWLRIPAHRRHRVDRTDIERPTVWLALHYRADGCKRQ